MISGLNIREGFAPSIKTMIRTAFPIIFAATRDQTILFFAGFDFIPKNIGSCINSLTILPPLMRQNLFLHIREVLVEFIYSSHIILIVYITLKNIGFIEPSGYAV